MDKKKCFVWTADAVAIVRARYASDGPKKLADELGTTPVSVTMKARRLGVEPASRRREDFEWTPAQIETLYRLYATADKATLVREIGLPIYAIRHKGQTLGLRSLVRAELSGRTRSAQRKSVDIHFFDKWSPDMAYVLGFLFTDGSITRRLCDVVIGLCDKDECVLDFIKKVTKSTRKYDRRKATVDKNGYKHGGTVFLTLASRPMVARLMELGMKPGKTYTDEPFPDVPDDMMPHFIRGAFDGDGTACLTSQGYCRVGFVGSPRFIIGIRDALVRLAGMRHATIAPCTNTKTPCVKALWGAQEDIRRFRDFTYPPGYSFCLERKKTVLDKWLASRVADTTSF